MIFDIMTKPVLLTFVLVFLANCNAIPVNDRPIIGVMGQRLRGKIPIPGVNGSSYVIASYVKFIESAGGRAVPIPTSMTEGKLTELFKHLNGVLLPGGNIDVKESPYRKNAELLVRLSKKAYDEEGDIFPIWGTCMGMQTLSVIAAESIDIISPSHGTSDMSIQLNFAEDFRRSRMFANASEEIIEILKRHDVTYNFHANCVRTDTYHKYAKLSNFFQVLSTNFDQYGLEFLSTIEGKKYPIYAVQWHPEIVSFEFDAEAANMTHINHSEEAIAVAQYFADFFINEARKSRHKFPSRADEQKYLIYNDEPYFTAPKGTFQEQTYYFD